MCHEISNNEKLAKDQKAKAANAKKESSNSWNNLKVSIKEYISEASSKWAKKARILVIKFDRLLKKKHPTM